MCVRRHCCGLRPVRFLKNREKKAGSSKPSSSARLAAGVQTAEDLQARKRLHTGVSPTPWLAGDAAFDLGRLLKS